MIHKLFETDEEAPKMLHLGSKPGTIRLGSRQPAKDAAGPYLDDFAAMTVQHPWDNRTRYFEIGGWPIMVELRSGAAPSDVIHIGSIIAPPELRGKGESSKVLKVLCDLADKHGVKLTLTAKPIPTQQKGLPATKLKAWYQRHGFVFKGEHGERPPNTAGQ